MKNIAKLLLGFSLALSVNFSWSQTTKATVSGIIQDDSKNLIGAASVSLISAKDSTSSKTVISGLDGSFTFNQVNFGKYRIVITYIGFDEYQSEQIEIDSLHASVLIPVIILHQNKKMLNAVSIVGRKSFIEQKIDRTIVNISGNPTTAGSNALDALGIAPGVSIGPDGSISINGQSGATVYIDGKPTYLNGTELANYLRSMPASLMDKLEVMPNPPAKYDASGNGGVINIILKKNTEAGFNGSINASYGQGIFARTSETLNFNYHADKLNIFGSLGYSIFKRKLSSDLKYQYLNPDGSVNSTLLTTSDNTIDSKSTNLKLGMDYQASKNTGFGIILNGIINPAPSNTVITNSILTSGLGIDSTIRGNNFNKYKKTNGSVNLNYDHKFDEVGRDVTINLDYIKYNSSSDQTFENDVYYPNNNLTNQELLLANLPANVNIYSFKIDYTHPFRHGGRFDIGVKTSYSNTDNAAAYYNVIDGQDVPDYTKTNTILYKETINAAYVNFDKSFIRLEVQAGLRLENTNSNGHQLGNAVTPDSSFRRNFTNLFPTLYISYKLDSSGKNKLVFSFGRRIRRPYYQDLNPFLFFIDKFTYSAGNPYLNPSISTNLQLSYRFADIFSVNLFHRTTSDFFYGTTQREGDIFINRLGNIGQYINYGISLDANIPVMKWWNIVVYSEYVNDRYNGNLYGSRLDTNAFAFDESIRNLFNFKNGWSFQVNEFFRTKRIEIQNVVDPYGYLDLAVNKRILGNRGVISLYAKDVLGTLKLSGITTNVSETAINYRNLFDTSVMSS